MTPFGQKLRELRKQRGVNLKTMAAEIGVSSAYLSALEHGKRGRPNWYLVQRVIAYFNIIWDDAEQLIYLAHLSHPKITIDTSGLSPNATALANRLADSISVLSESQLQAILNQLMMYDAAPRSCRLPVQHRLERLVKSDKAARS